MKSSDNDLPSLDPHVIAVLRSTVRDLNLSARMYARILIVARNFADWARSEKIDTRHVLEAVQFCTLGG